MGVSRDLTPLFCRARIGHRHAITSTKANNHLHGGGEKILSEEVNSFQENKPDWIQTTKRVEEILLELDVLISSLEESNQQLLFHFTDEIGDSSHDNKRDNLRNTFLTKFEFCKTLIQRILAEQIGSKSEIVICDNIQRALATKLQQRWMKFRKIQNDYLNRMKKMKSIENSLSFQTNNEEDELEAQKYSRSVFQKESTRRVLQEARNKEIQKISTSIQELNNIFQELAVLVIEQEVF